MKKLSSLTREQTLKEMVDMQFDVIVIGGGITGAGIALDAASRGMKTALVEMQDFAAGTSSRSTKLVHGGLRYLQQLELKMVADVGKERKVVYENGPHVTTPEWMILPFHSGSNLGPLTTAIGLTLYDFLAGVKPAERRAMLTEEETLIKEPLIKRENLKGAGHYVEYKTDDARLTIEVIKKAIEYGAKAINYTKAAEFHYNEQQLTGIEAIDEITGKTYVIKGKKVINATGPWVDTLREKDGSKKEKTLLLTKGVHLVFDQRTFPLKNAVYFDTPDKRMIFAIPRAGTTYVGTTDTVYEGDLSNPTATKEDRDYILKAIEYMFPQLNIQASDVKSSWAGLRPLIAEEGKDNPGEISRKDEVFVSRSGLISIAGGKLTGYRKMAEEIVNVVAKQLKAEEGILYSNSETKHIPISGGEVGGSKGFERFKQEKIREAEALGIPVPEAEALIQRYGANVDSLLSIYMNNRFEAEYKGMTPLIFAELKYAMEAEAVCTPSDFFIRRTGMLFFAIDAVKTYQEAVITYMAEQLNWTDSEKNRYQSELISHLNDAVSHS